MLTNPIRAAAAAGELLGAHVFQDPSFFSYSQAYAPDRFQDDDYVQQLADSSGTGQL